VDELLEHPLGHLVVGDNALAQGADRDDVAGRAAQQGLRISNAQDTAEASSLSKFSGPDAVWTSDLEETNYSLNKRYTDTMIAGLVDYRCNSVGIAVKDGKMSIVYLRITEIPAENS